MIQSESNVIMRPSQPASLTSPSLIDPASPPRDFPVDRRALVTLQPVQTCQPGVVRPRTLTQSSGHPHLHSGRHGRGGGGGRHGRGGGCDGGGDGGKY